MSILEEVNELCRAGTLFRLLPQSLPSLAGKSRLLYVSKEITHWLDGPWPEQKQEVRWNQLRANLEAFVEGKPIALSGRRDQPPSNPCAMAQLRPPDGEVWEIRHRRPKPSIRLFGRFATKDFFIALTWECRKDLRGADSQEFHDAILRCRTEWDLLFHRVYTAHTGDYPNDYLSNAYLI